MSVANTEPMMWPTVDWLERKLKALDEAGIEEPCCIGYAPSPLPTPPQDEQSS